MRKKSSKTKRDFQPLSTHTPPERNETKLESFDQFKIDDIVWYRVSINLPKYSHGTIKEITQPANDDVTFSIWDREQGMWRFLTLKDVYREKPPRKKRGS